MLYFNCMYLGIQLNQYSFLPDPIKLNVQPLAMIRTRSRMTRMAMMLKTSCEIQKCLVIVAFGWISSLKLKVFQKFFISLLLMCH
jgi:hypothetical protein